MLFQEVFDHEAAASSESEEEYSDLRVVGKACIFFDDAASYSEESTLVTMGGVKVDRFDCRQLLSDYGANEKSSLALALAHTVDEDNEDEDINFERYRDLSEGDNGVGADTDAEIEPSAPVKYASNVERNWYRYPKSDGAENNAEIITVRGGEDESLVDESFVLPTLLPACPEGIEAPRNQKTFDLIIHTAKKTRTHSQLEILIKVKQENNFAFDFLHDDSPLHGFYKVSFHTMTNGHIYQEGDASTAFSSIYVFVFGASASEHNLFYYFISPVPFY